MKPNEKNLREMSELRVTFLEAESMRTCLGLMRDLPNTKTYLIPLLLELAGRELLVHEALWELIRSVTIAFEHQNAELLIPWPDVRRLDLLKRIPAIFKAMIAPDKELLSSFTRFYKHYCNHYITLVAVYAEQEEQKEKKVYPKAVR